MVTMDTYMSDDSLEDSILYEVSTYSCHSVLDKYVRFSL